MTTSIFVVFQRIDRVKNVHRDPTKLLTCCFQSASLHSTASARLQTILVRVLAPPCTALTYRLLFVVTYPNKCLHCESKN